MAAEARVKPIELKQVGERSLGVSWSDGHRSEYPGDYLRGHCPCAGCVDEWTGRQKLDLESIAEDIHPVRVQGVGRYAIKIDWSDRHDTGLYTFEFLRKICPCPECKEEYNRGHARDNGQD
jgi:DUF971 family protein